MKIEIPSDFVKANINIKNGDIVKLLDEGKYNKIKGTDGKMKEVLQFQLGLPNGDIKTYTMNVTTQREMIKAFGDDSKNWVEEPLKVNVMKQTAFGKLVDVLVLTPTGILPIEDKDIPVIEDED